MYYQVFNDFIIIIMRRTCIQHTKKIRFTNNVSKPYSIKMNQRKSRYSERIKKKKLFRNFKHPVFNACVCVARNLILQLQRK